MKTTISVPDDLFREADALVRNSRRSRSEFYSRALAEYVARHAPERVQEAMDRAIDEIGEVADEFAIAASQRVLRRVEW